MEDNTQTLRYREDNTHAHSQILRMIHTLRYTPWRIRNLKYLEMKIEEWPSRAKWGQAGQNRVKWGQIGPNRAIEGKTGPDWAKGV